MPRWPAKKTARKTVKRTPRKATRKYARRLTITNSLGPFVGEALLAAPPPSDFEFRKMAIDAAVRHQVSGEPLLPLAREIESFLRGEPAPTAEVPADAATEE